MTALRQFQVPQWLDDVNDLLQRIQPRHAPPARWTIPISDGFTPVGYKDFNIFVTAEFVEGQTLREIMSARTPDFGATKSWSLRGSSAPPWIMRIARAYITIFLNAYNVKILPGNE